MNEESVRNIAENELVIFGARENNLKNINVTIPRNALVVFTGLSGSGKSSLAFNTLYAEGQRRYMETFSAYARQFIGNLEHPDVDKITGLSPVISIEQKTISKNPRSTVGTITEIYDFLRLLYARVSNAYSYNTGELMKKYSENEILDNILSLYNNQNITILAPLVKGRKGHYRELFEYIRRQGYVKVRIDGVIKELTTRMQTDRYKIHDIEVVVDKILVTEKVKLRLTNTIKSAFKIGKGTIIINHDETGESRNYSKSLMCPSTGISYMEPEPNTFSFNSPYGACPKCNGLGIITVIDRHKIIPDDNISIRKGGILPIGSYKPNLFFKQLEVLASRFHFSLDVPIKEIDEDILQLILFGTDEIVIVKNEITGLSPQQTIFQGVIGFLKSQESETMPASLKKWINQFTDEQICDECGGKRLKKESLFFKIGNKNIADLSQMDLKSLWKWFQNTDQYFTKNQAITAHEIIREITFRLQFLLNVGLPYLSLDRPSKSLSGGEAQRIRLATQISSQLVNVLYILDEPSIGLHSKDNDKLIKSLKELRDLSNSVIVVEHDQKMMEEADFIVDIGPRAGENGGQIMYAGNYKNLLKAKTLTADYLSGRKQIKIPEKYHEGNGKTLSLIGATGHNLKNISIDFPLGKLICITGVSGSGKSTLINQTLYPILNHHFYRAERKPLPYQDIIGLENLDKVIEIDQQPIGRSPRSNPVTYCGIFDDIRQLFASTPESKIRNYKPGRFSFNVSGGRCESCKGNGLETIEMNFLPDVYVKCNLCHGKRYNAETLEIFYKGKNIADILDMDIEHAVDFFENIPIIYSKLKVLKEVGLGYIKLGQPATTLSGGEAQRIKLASELSKKETGNTLYILDEPTTGLHFEDINVLLNILNQLVERGNTVLVIEHNLDVIKVSDYIIDMGPEGGEAGGQIIAQGTPIEIINHKESYTATYLEPLLKLQNYGVH